MKILNNHFNTGSIVSVLLLFVTVISCNQDIAGTADDSIHSANTIHYSVGDDELCPAGTFSSDGTGPDCIAAPQGFFVPTVGATEAIACEVGTYQDETGQTSCKSAEPGSFVDIEGAAASSLCPIGTFSDVYGAAVCTACAIGETTDGPGATACILITNDPATKADCMKGGWEAFGFKNQGQCIRFVNTGKDSR